MHAIEIVFVKYEQQDHDTGGDADASPKMFKKLYILFLVRFRSVVFR